MARNSHDPLWFHKLCILRHEEVPSTDSRVGVFDSDSVRLSSACSLTVAVVGLFMVLTI